MHNKIVYLHVVYLPEQSSRSINISKAVNTLSSTFQVVLSQETWLRDLIARSVFFVKSLLGSDSPCLILSTAFGDNADSNGKSRRVLTSY